MSDPLEIVAGEISDEAILLCVDEFMVLNLKLVHFLSLNIFNGFRSHLVVSVVSVPLYVIYIASTGDRCR